MSTDAAAAPTRPRSSVTRDSALSMIALVALGGTRVVYGSLISRNTDAATYGMVGTLTAVTMLASLLLPTGIGSAISRYVPFSRGAGDLVRGRGLYRLLSRMALASAILLAIASAWVTLLFGRPWSDAAQVMLLTLAYSLYVTEKAGLYGFGRVGTYVRLELVASAVTLAATGILIASDATWYLLPLIAGYAVFVAAARLGLRPDMRGTTTGPDRSQGREILAFVTLACIGALAGTGFLQATQLLAAGYASATAAAYFTATIALISPLYLLPRALSLALFPFLSQAHGAGDFGSVRSHTDIATRTLVALLAPVFVAAELLAPVLLTVYSGGSLTEGSLVLQLILLAAFLSIIQVPSVNVLSSGSGLQLRVPVAWTVAGTLTGLVAVAILAPNFDASGIAMGYVIGIAVSASGTITVVWRRYRTPWGRPMLLAIVLILGAFVLARTLEAEVPWTSAAWLRYIAAAAGAAAIATFALRREILGILAFARAGRSRGVSAGAQVDGGPGEPAGDDKDAIPGAEEPNR